MQTINQTVPFKGALKCSIYLSTYFNMPLTNEQEIEAANQTLNIAFDCLNAVGVPFLKKGCDLKYEISKDKLIPSVYPDEGYYKSQCVTNSGNYYYAEDRLDYIAEKYNQNLRDFESTTWKLIT